MLKRVRPTAFVLFGSLATVAALALAVHANAAEPAIDVFGRPAPASALAAPPGASVSSVAPAASETKPSSLSLPEPLRVAIATGIVWQGELNAKIADAADRLRRHATPRTWFALLLLSFAYGVLHAAGPGHGKLVTGAYLGSRRVLRGHAMVLCAWTATVQALSAIALVFGVTWFAKAGMADVLTQAASLEVVSYALLCLAGAWTLYSSIARRDCCFDPSAVELVPKKRTASPPAFASNEEPYLAARLPLHRRARTFAPAGASTFSQIVATGFAAGMRPCVGAIFVLTASVSARVPSIGIAATFAMAAGVTVTVTLVGLGALGANRLFAKRPMRHRARMQMAQRWIAASGGLLIMLFAAAQLWLLMSGHLQPSLT